MHRTESGKAVSGIMSGWSSYNVDKKEEQSRTIPPIVSPGDVLAAIRELEKLFSLPQIEQALTLLYDHINDKNNPHGTTLDQFTQTVADILYIEYVKRGGTVNKIIYLKNLFETLRIATLDEMKTSTDKKLVISVVNARRFLEDHETDPDAHKELFDRLIPGKPTLLAPTFGVLASIGLSPYSSDYSHACQTYVGKDGLVHTAKKDEYPADYCWGDASFPVFKETTNLIKESNNFNRHTLWNITTIIDAETDPTGNDKALAVFSIEDIEPVNHTISITNIDLPHGKMHTFSVYAKAESCRYLSISYKDFVASDIIVYGIFDLVNGTCSTFNNMNRYGTQIQKLANGWYRCIFNMYHEVGTVSEINLTFFKEKKNNHDMTFSAQSELLGYLFGLQYEANRTASPYIPTDENSNRYRPALNITFPIHEDFWNIKRHTISVSWIDVPQELNDDIVHPILSTVDNEGQPSTVIEQIRDRTIRINKYASTETDEGKYAIAEGSIVIQSDDILDIHKVTNCFDHGSKSLTGYDSSISEDISPMSYNEETQLNIGFGLKNYFDGYIRSILVYPGIVNEDNIKFIHGEVLYG